MPARALRRPTTGANAALKAAEQDRIIKRLTMARDITHKFVESTAEMENLMDVIFENVLEVLQAEAGSLWMVDWATKENDCHLAEGPAKEKIIGLKLAQGQGIVGHVIAQGKATIVLDTAKDADFDQQVDQNTGFVTKSLICVPLKVGKHVYGAIQILNKKGGVGGCFDSHDLDLVDDLATSAALAIKNARLLETESRVREMNTLMGISREIVASLDLDQVLETVVNTANELADVHGGAIGLVHEKTNELHLAVLSGEQKVEQENNAQKRLLDILRDVHQSGRTGYIADVDEFDADEQTQKWVDYLKEKNLRGAWAAPLKDDEGTLGVLWYESEKADCASGNKADMLNILCSQATLALRNASVFNSIPLSSALGKLSAGTRGLLETTTQKWTWGSSTALVLLLALHFLPIFRSVSGHCVVEARLGQGVFLPVAGRVQEVLVQEGDMVEAGQVLARLDEAPIRLALMSAESRLALLERQIVEARAAEDPAMMSRAVIERVAAQAQVKKARDDLARVEIQAKTAGLVLTPRPHELHGRVFPLGAEVLRLSDPNDYTVVVHLPEEHVLNIVKGQEVKGSLRAVPGQGFRGVVRHVGRSYQVPSEALDQEQVAAAELDTGFIAEIEVRESDVTLRPGMTGKANIYTPDSSFVVLTWRSLRNFIAFTFGI